MPGTFELTKDGLKLPYLRFLSDSAAGFVLILTLVVAYHDTALRGMLKNSGAFEGMVSASYSNAMKIVILILVVALTIPLGLAINAISWFILGPFIYALQSFCYRKSESIFKTIRTEYMMKECEKFFNVKPDAPDIWYKKVQVIKRILFMRNPELMDAIEHVRGIRTFFRNLSFLTFVFALASLLISIFTSIPAHIAAGVWLTIAILTFLLAGISGFNYNCQVYERALVICRMMDITGPFTDAHGWDIVRGLSALPQKSETGRVSLGPTATIAAPAPDAAGASPNKSGIRMDGPQAP